MLKRAERARNEPKGWSLGGDEGTLPDDMAHTITLIPGDGIGPEVADATRRVLEASGVKIDW